MPAPISASDRHQHPVDLSTVGQQSLAINPRVKIQRARGVKIQRAPTRYSLTLHGPYGKRILGYDNAHAVKPPKKFKYAGRILAYDHKHRHASDQGVPYEFKDVHQLMCDFFADVDRILSEVKGP